MNEICVLWVGIIKIFGFKYWSEASSFSDKTETTVLHKPYFETNRCIKSDLQFFFLFGEVKQRL